MLLLQNNINLDKLTLSFWKYLSLMGRVELSWYRGCFPYQRSTLQIQSLVKKFTLHCIKSVEEKTKINKMELFKIELYSVLSETTRV